MKYLMGFDNGRVLEVDLPAPIAFVDVLIGGIRSQPDAPVQLSVFRDVDANTASILRADHMQFLVPADQYKLVSVGERKIVTIGDISVETDSTDTEETLS